MFVNSNAGFGPRNFIKFNVYADLQVKYGCGHVAWLLMTTGVTWLLGLKLLSSAERKSSLSGQRVLEGFLSYLHEMFG